jgi:uncharacterized protein (DUF927 family)
MSMNRNISQAEDRLRKISARIAMAESLLPRILEEYEEVGKFFEVCNQAYEDAWLQTIECGKEIMLHPKHYFLEIWGEE